MQRRPWLRWSGNALVAVGAGLVVVPLIGATARPPVTVPLVAAAIAPVVAQPPAPHPPAEPPAPAPAAAEPKLTVWPEARLILPDLRLELPVLDGSDPDRMAIAPVYYPDSALPDEAGRIVITGHNNAYGAPFRDLQRLQPGSVVYLWTPSATWQYRVEALDIVKPDVLDPYLDEPTAGLTLLTCHPYWHPTRRLLVRATPLGLATQPPRFRLWDESSKPTTSSRK